VGFGYNRREFKPGMVVHTYNFSILKDDEAGGSKV
jgi:hypothetical protein